MNRQNGKAYNIALGGMVAALSLVFMFLAMVFPQADLVFPALAGVLLICTLSEIGPGWSYMIFAAVGILSLLILPAKQVAVYYILFLGHYPITKCYIERIENKLLNWLAKLVVFNACTVLVLDICEWLFDFSGGILKYYYYLPTVLLFIAAFVVYDIALDKLAVLYSTRIHKIIHKR